MHSTFAPVDTKLGKDDTIFFNVFHNSRHFSQQTFYGVSKFHTT